MECPMCKKSFDENTGRRPKKFCSDACKVKFWNGFKRVKKRIERAEIKAVVKEAVQNLATFGQSVVHTPSMTTGVTVEEVQQKQELQTEIDNLTAQMNAIQEGNFGTPLRNKLQDKINKLKKQLK